ncbi:secreted protein [Congregibacter litoralis]|uniref:Outer membrane protein beta-barrel domain protein n=1 Tax=Congregibacter litoralis KT71 TaxID=314285 RepID=A4AAE9_9GAMM|nr:secreted protein [Congregibacter litoralis]EAQ97026.1 Outer membrane protein beta-barrel domain protein [Congregibacter litoralis KT71]
MSFRTYLALLVTAPLMAPVMAQAEDRGRFYVGAGGGVVFAGNTRADGVFTGTGSSLDGQRLGPKPGSTAKGDFDASPTVNLTLGYDFGKQRYGRLRLEGELFYQQADTDNYKGELDGRGS